MTPREITALILSGLSGFLTVYGLFSGPLWIALAGTLAVVAMYAVWFLAPTWLKGKRS